MPELIFASAVGTLVSFRLAFHDLSVVFKSLNITEFAYA
jgi:hypothetical protein